MPDRSRRPPRRSRDAPSEKPALEVEDLNVYYGTFRAIKNISLDVKRHQVTAIIGPSGCGKSTFLRTLNRMHELTPHARVEGKVDARRDRHHTARTSTRCSSGGSSAWSSSGPTRSR